MERCWVEVTFLLPERLWKLEGEFAEAIMATLTVVCLRGQNGWD